MSKLLVMTDLHLTSRGKRIIGLDPLQRFEDGLNHAATHHPDADRLILTGDLSHYGETKSYQHLAEALKNRPWPVSFLLGNHDERAKFRTSFPDCPTDGYGFVQSVVDLGKLHLIMLDSLDEDGRVPMHAGFLCEQRLAWLSDQLVAAGDTPCLLFLHHPPFMTGFTGMDAIRLQNEAELLDLIESGPIAHIFAGHVHRTVMSSVRGIPVTVFKSTCHQMPMQLGAEGSHHSVDEPGAYGIILTDGPDVVVHSEDFSLPARVIGHD